MTAELERYKTLCVAQEAEIARLKQGFDELKAVINNWMLCDDVLGNIISANVVIANINRITGEQDD